MERSERESEGDGCDYSITILFNYLIETYQASPISLNISTSLFLDFFPLEIDKF